MALFLVQENLRRESAPTAAISGVCQFSFGGCTRAADLPQFDIAELPDNEQAMAEYLTVVLEENDPAALAGALGSIARARGRMVSNTSFKFHAGKVMLPAVSSGV